MFSSLALQDEIEQDVGCSKVDVARGSLLFDWTNPRHHALMPQTKDSESTSPLRAAFDEQWHQRTKQKAAYSTYMYQPDIGISSQALCLRLTKLPVL